MTHVPVPCTPVERRVLRSQQNRSLGLPTQKKWSTCRQEDLPAQNNHHSLIVKLTRALLKLMSPLLIHLLIRRPRQQKKRADNQQTAEDRRRGQG